MTFELDELNTGFIPEWIREIKEIFQESEKRRLPENKREYDYVIELI